MVSFHTGLRQFLIVFVFFLTPSVSGMSLSLTYGSDKPFGSIGIRLRPCRTGTEHKQCNGGAPGNGATGIRPTHQSTSESASEKTEGNLKIYRRINQEQLEILAPRGEKRIPRSRKESLNDCLRVHMHENLEMVALNPAHFVFTEEGDTTTGTVVR